MHTHLNFIFSSGKKYILLFLDTKNKDIYIPLFSFPFFQGRTAYMGPENFGLAADSEIFTISIRLAQEFNTVLLDTASVEYQTLKQDIINAVRDFSPALYFFNDLE